MPTGKQVRLNRIFSADKKAVVIAMDHGLPGVAPLAHLVKPGKLLKQVIEGGGDAILTTPGIAETFADQIGPLGLILRLDGGATMMSESPGEMSLISSVEDALKLGADAVAVMGFCGTPEESTSLRILGAVAKECRRLGVPLLAEMLPFGFSAKPNASQLARAARVGCEMGADLIKIKYSGPPEAYKEVIASSFSPVLILGGGARSAADVLAEIHDAIGVGASGVAIGRNVWQSDDPAEMTRSIVKVVHGS